MSRLIFIFVFVEYVFCKLYSYLYLFLRKKYLYNLGGVGLVGALRLGHWWGCSIGQYATARTSKSLVDKITCWQTRCVGKNACWKMSQGKKSLHIFDGRVGCKLKVLLAKYLVDKISHWQNVSLAKSLVDKKSSLKNVLLS